MKVKFIYGIISASVVSTLLLMNHVSAVLDWQDEVDVQFTFNPALSVSISEGDIVIPNLGVGTRDDSNEITITVGTNNVAGYQLSATVGNNTTYDTRNLKHDTSATALFSSLDVGSSLAQLTTPSTWGYSTNSGTSYSGLPKYDDTTNVAILNDSNTSGTETTNFLIGAYADQSQLAGDYRNVINFNVVTNVVKYTIANAPDMQSVAPGAEGCPSTLPLEQIYTLTDNRGANPETYKVARLKDGKCWMVENLNLAGGTALSASDTNVDSSYISSFTTSDGLTKTGDTIVLPASSTSGFNINNYSYVYNSGNKADCGASGQNTPCYSYYSWDAATLGSGRSITEDNADAPYSICPKGWRLPTVYSTDVTNWQTTSDFYVLAHQYGLDSTTSIIEDDSDFYTQAGPGTVPNFLLAGRCYLGSFYNGGTFGRYWSSTLRSNTGYARSMYFYSSTVNLAGSDERYLGSSVRCLLQ